MVGSYILWDQYIAGLRSIGLSGEIYTSGPDQRYYFSQPVDHSYWNENFTSKEADEILIKMNVSRKKRKSFQDMLAACLIIDSYLRSLR